jgi:hypothetical protein
MIGTRVALGQPVGKIVAIVPALLCVAAAAPARADGDKPALWTIEARAGGGIALGGGQGPLVWKGAPFNLGGVGEFAIITQPWTSIYVSGQVEVIRTASFAAAAGVRVRPWRDMVRFGAGVATVIAPATLLGVQATGGNCWKLKPKPAIRVCGDVEIDAFFFGGDLPPSRIAAQLKLQAGIAFDLL